MQRQSLLFRALWAIGAITVLSGLGQLFLPSLVLRLIGGETTPGAAHSFGIVGMFMVLFGGLLLDALRAPAANRTALRWAGLQKLGAAGAVGLGVARGLFGPLALGVAGFDLLSAVLVFVYLGTLARSSDPAPAPRTAARRTPAPA